MSVDAIEDTRPPASYHPFLNGDDMDSDEEEREAGVMEVERAVAANQVEATRREQSARASRLIGEKLLQGYGLLDEICPTPTCYGIPLLRLPREPEKRLCVICGKIYPEQIASNVPLPSAVPLPAPILPTPVLLPPIQPIEPTLPPISQSLAVIDQLKPKEFLDRAYLALATEMGRLSSYLATLNTSSKDYDEYLERIQRIAETMYTMRKS